MCLMMDLQPTTHAVNKVDAMPSSCLNGEQFSLIWIAMLSSTALCMLLLSQVGSLCGYSNIDEI